MFTGPQVVGELPPPSPRIVSIVSVYVLTMTSCSSNSTPKLLLWQPPLIGFLRVQAHNFYLFHRAMGQHLPMAYLDHVQKCPKPYIVSPNGDISYCPHDMALMMTGLEIIGTHRQLSIASNSILDFASRSPSNSCPQYHASRHRLLHIR
jgi:hypothetical protein